MRARTAGRPGPGPGGDEASTAGTRLFLALARVVAAMAEIRGVRSFTLPYPNAAQHALDRAVTHCLDIGEAPPRSLPELLRWCRVRTSDDRLFGVPASLVTPGSTLVHPVGLFPTRTCLEAASHGEPGGVEREAHTLLGDLADRCGYDERFRRCRSFLARHPVVQQRDRFGPGWSTSVWTRVRGLYQPLPTSLVVDGLAVRCPVCGLPALPGRGGRTPLPGQRTADDEIWCEGESCPRDADFELIREPEETLVLRRSLRAFLVLPYRVETAALKALAGAGIEYGALPGSSGGYHLPAAGTGTVDLRMYDRTQPGLLAARLAESPPLADRTFVVVPPRLAARDGYRAAFTAALPGPLRERLVLTAPDDLVRRIGSPTGGGIQTDRPNQEGTTDDA
ncbi:hypothetical protein AB0G74_20925 [Streptomyces sp. NPDC020875]|uniref:pPIWI_RE_Y domain-containing protein n=1 Tax=Streptomyces sp. NPDC020875 TaxID=3154898 RepID=UPI0033D798D6